MGTIATNSPGVTLSVRQLRKTYGHRTVVHDMTLDLHSGEVVGLLGPNGAGKTTSFYMIAGIVAKDAGHIYLDGHEIGHMPMHERAMVGIAYLPQEASVFRQMTAYENILSILELHNHLHQYRLSPKQMRSQVMDLMMELHIDHLEDSLASALSGGERRRVEIARVLIQNPKIVLLDEPFAGVDPIAVGDIRHLIDLLLAKNIAVLITDHNVRETLGICSRSYIVSEGRVVASGTAEEIVANPTVRKVYLGEDFRL